MKWFIIAVIVAAVLVAFVVVVNPVLIAVSSGPGPRIESKVSLKDGAIACDLLLRNAKAERYITELKILRSASEMMKIGTPDGFRIEEMPATESDDKEWVKNWNRENVRFIGRLKIAPGVPVTLVIPASTSTLEGLEIGGQFETGKTFGNMISFFTAKPIKTEPNQALQSNAGAAPSADEALPPRG